MQHGSREFLLARKTYILISEKTFTKYIKSETSDSLKRRHCILNRGESPASPYAIFNRAGGDA
jgi:hypothetical protein